MAVRSVIILWIVYLIQKVSSMNIENVFSNDQENPTFEKPVINSRNGQVILGSKNLVYKLSPQLTVLQKRSIGPVSQGVGQTSVNVFVKGLVINKGDSSLILCSTVSQGSCQVLSVDDLSEVKTPYLPSMVSNDPSPNVLFLGSGVSNKTVLYIASWYTLRYGVADTEYLSNSILMLSSRNPQTLKLTTTSSGVQTSIYTRESNETEAHLKFIHGFSYGNFVYFISRFYDKESRITRLCKLNPTIDTLVDFPVVCGKNDHSIVQGADFDEKTGNLYMVFRKMRGEEGRRGLVSSVVCKYRMSDVERQFNLAVNDCHQGKGQLGPYYIHQKVPCPKVSAKVDDPYCSKVPGGFASIEGLQPIFSRSIISLNDVYLSSIAIIAQKGSTAIIVSSADGVLRKYIKSGSIVKEVDQMRINDIKEGVGMSVSPDKKSVYVVTNSELLKISISHCERSTTCQECVSTSDPVCGWCNMDSRCTEKGNCRGSMITPPWLSAAMKESCAKMADLKPSLLNYENISRNQHQHQISFKLSDVSLSNGSNSIHCAFTAMSVTARTPASVDNDVITCLLPSNSSLELKPKGTVFDYHHDLEVEFHVGGRAFVKRSVPVFDCTVHKTCTDCRKSLFNCSWHYQTHTCSALSVVSLKPSVDPGTTSYDSCPRVEIPASKNADIIVHSGDSLGLVVKLVNMKAGQTDELWCRFRYLDKTETIPGKEESGTLTCDKVQFEYSQEKSNVDATFEVLWGPKKFPLDMYNNTTGMCSPLSETAAQTDKKLTGLKLTRPVYRLAKTYIDLRKITNCMK